MPILPGAEPYSHDGGDIGVLVCHGYSGSPQAMRPWAEHLAAHGYTVRLPRLPGHGTTWQELNKTRWQDWYGELDTAFGELRGRCGVVFVVGLSMGALLATKVAQEHGPEVRGLVLVNPIYAHPNPLLRVLPLLRHVVPSLPGIAGDIKKPGATELAYDRNPLHSMHSQTQLWSIVAKDLPQVTAPVLLIRSTDDHVVPASSSEFFLKRVGSPDVTEIVLEDSYHVATIDNEAQLIFDASVSFIERVAHAPA